MQYRNMHASRHTQNSISIYSSLGQRGWRACTVMHEPSSKELKRFQPASFTSVTGFM